MATTSKALFRGAASTSSATLYTVPSATTTVVTDIVVTNTATSSANFTLSFNDVVFAQNVTVGASDSTIIQVKQPLATTQTIKGLASATTVNFHIGGVEIS
jgi:Ulp1 family protease